MLSLRSSRGVAAAASVVVRSAKAKFHHQRRGLAILCNHTNNSIGQHDSDRDLRSRNGRTAIAGTVRMSNNHYSTLPSSSSLSASSVFQPTTTTTTKREYHPTSLQQQHPPMMMAKKLFDLRLNTLPSTGTHTKIVCTIGPSTDTSEKISQLLQHGMHVARLNFSHAGSDYTYPETCFSHVRNAIGMHKSLHEDGQLSTTNGNSSGSDTPELPNNLRAILVDTKGPEIRTGPLQGNVDVATIQVGDVVELTLDDVSNEPAPAEPEPSSDSRTTTTTTTTTTHRINIDYQSICTTVEVGKNVLLDDGLIALEVMEIDVASNSVKCIALNGGPIKKNKGVNLPDMQLDLPALTAKDKRDLKWSCRIGADYVAASFIRNAANVRSVKAYLESCIVEINEELFAATGSSSSNNSQYDYEPRIRPLVISKIENKEGVDNFDEILHESDGIMVARGDLGVEIPYSKVFAAQKMMVQKCNEVGKPVIVATQMLDSMMRNPRPTRAEVTDVGTAVLDGADAVMLSGETAAGKYPIESLRSMASVVWEADTIHDNEFRPIWNQTYHSTLSTKEQELDAVAHSAVKSANDMGAQAIVLLTHSGKVARAVARHRPNVPVLTYCSDPQVGRRLQLHRCLTPIMLQGTRNPMAPGTRMDLLRAEAIRTARELGFVKAGDRIIMVDRTLGKSHDNHDVSHNMKVVTLRDM